MKHEPAIFEEPDAAAEDASFDRAMADLAAGRFHSHAVVREWLQTWGTASQVPFKEWLAARNG